MTEAYIPCDNCICALHNDRREFIKCTCPERDSAGRCQCDEAKRIIEKIGGA